MTEQEIRMAVARGHGRALLFLGEHPERARFDLIYELCARNQTFDRMEDRDDYMARLAMTLLDPNQLVEPLGCRLFTLRDRKTRSQVRGILAHFVREGHAGATAILVKDFHRFRLPEKPFKEAIEYLGLPGLHLLLGQMKRLEDWEISWIHQEATERLGDEATNAAFQQAGLDLPKKSEGPPKKRDILLPGAILTRLEAGGWASFADFQRLATDEDWHKAADIGLTSTDSEIVCRAGWLFRGRPFPVPAGHVIAKAERDEDLSLRKQRLLLLRETRSLAIRAWAVGRLKSKLIDPELDAAFVLMEKNAEVADEPILFEALRRLKSKPEEFHYAALWVKNLRVNPSTRLLNLIYEVGRCSFCREAVVEQLIKRGALTKAQRAECLEDSSDYTRELAGGSRRPS